jgi:hypothetical protein
MISIRKLGVGKLKPAFWGQDIGKQAQQVCPLPAILGAPKFV